MSGGWIVHANSVAVSDGKTNSESPSQKMTLAIATSPARTPGVIGRGPRLRRGGDGLALLRRRAHAAALRAGAGARASSPRPGAATTAASA